MDGWITVDVQIYKEFSLDHDLKTLWIKTTKDKAVSFVRWLW